MTLAKWTNVLGDFQVHNARGPTLSWTPAVGSGATAAQRLGRCCGQVVADPVMLNRAGTALAARKAGCTCIGATEVESCRDHIANNKTQVKPPGLPFL